MTLCDEKSVSSQNTIQRQQKKHDSLKQRPSEANSRHLSQEIPRLNGNWGLLLCSEQPSTCPYPDLDIPVYELPPYLPKI
jgi:hypothetical protein